LASNDWTIGVHSLVSLVTTEEFAWSAKSSISSIPPSELWSYCHVVGDFLGFRKC